MGWAWAAVSTGNVCLQSHDPPARSEAEEARSQGGGSECLCFPGALLPGFWSLAFFFPTKAVVKKETTLGRMNLPAGGAWGRGHGLYCCGQRFTSSWWPTEKGHSSSDCWLVLVLQFGGTWRSRLPSGSSGSRPTCHFQLCELAGVTSLPERLHPDYKVNIQTGYTLGFFALL